jgi:signal peptidase I
MEEFKENNNTETITEEKSTETKTEEQAQAKKHYKFKDYLDALLFAAIVALILKTFIVEAYRIPTGSMENTLMVGDFLLVNKFIYGPSTPRNIPFTNIRLPYLNLPGIKEPKKGDVVVFDYPGDIEVVKPPEVINYIKRLVGEPGDTILIKKQVLFVNGVEFPKPETMLIDRAPMSENAGATKIFPHGSGWNEDNYGPIRVPKKEDVVKITSENLETYKMLIMREGHSIRITADNKIFIDEKESPEYKIEKDYYFVMGDHRTNSADSRYWGFLARENIIGDALLVYWSWDPGIPFNEPLKLLSSVRWNRIAKLIN